MVSSIPASFGNTFFVVIPSCSRDAYGLDQMRLLNSDTRGGVGGLYLQEMIEKDASRIAAYVSGYLVSLCELTSGAILLVYGGDSEVLNYHSDFALVYNAYIKVVSDSIREACLGVSIVRGVALRGIQTDMFGQITAGLDQVVSAYALFAWQAKYVPPGEEGDSEDLLDHLMQYPGRVARL